MVYKLGNKSIKIPDKEIEKNMALLQISKEEAIQMYLEDEGYLDNEEQKQLTKKAQESGILNTIHGAGDKKARKKPEKPRTTKVSDEKKELFDVINSTVRDFYGENVQILTENKLISVKINNKTFKIDLIEQRKKKN